QELSGRALKDGPRARRPVLAAGREGHRRGPGRDGGGCTYNGRMNDFNAVRDYLTGLQDRTCAAMEAADGAARFHEDAWTRPDERASGGLAGGGRTRVMREGAVFEQAGIGFSDVRGSRLPPSATANRPELAGASWRAVGVSLV